jgi:hypothetical protein
MQTILTLLCGPRTLPVQQSATSPLLSLKHIGNYMPVGGRVKIGSDNDTFHFPFPLCSHFQDGCLLKKDWEFSDVVLV